MKRVKGIFLLVSVLMFGCNGANSDKVVEVSGRVEWRKYAAGPNADGVAWQLFADENKTRYILKNPPKEIADKCGMCKFHARMKLKVIKEYPADGQAEAEVLEVLSLHEELCDH